MQTFQVIDYQDVDIGDDATTSDDRHKQEERYEVRVFGRTSLNDPINPDASVCLRLTGFRPYFFLRVPLSFKPDTLDKWFTCARNLYGLKVGAVEKKFDFDGFQAGQKRCFVKISTSSSKMMKRAAQMINGAMRLESAIWVNLKANTKQIDEEIKNRFGCQRYEIAETKRGEPRADSTDVAIQIRFRDQSTFLKAIYHKKDVPPDLKHFDMYLRNNPEYRLYESNIDPILRVMHERKIRGCSWVKLPSSVLQRHSVISVCNLEGDMDHELLEPDPEREQAAEPARWRTLSYDIETMSTDPNGGFPQASRKGDAVIQIGLTFNYFQQTVCYKKILLSLKSCDNFAEDVIVKSFDEESELLRAFVKILEEEDPDIITGYNIFGFDNSYLKDRAALLDIADEFSFWSRLQESCIFQEKKLSSSALGDNKMFLYKTPGRVQIDLFKVIQRDHNLPSYKLDSVSSHFNQNTIKSVDGTSFITADVSGLEEGGFFSIKVIEAESCGVEDDLPGKFRILSIKKTECGEYCVEFEGEDSRQLQGNMSACELRWCLSKDDLPPRKIFEFWPMDAAHRAIIGKYCIKDTHLVSFLMEKLNILSNNSAMSNVCSVPLPYIFLRGQGIKTHSLVSERCRRDGYLIPTIRKDDLVNMMFRKKEDSRKMGPWEDSDTECTYDECSAKGRLEVWDGGVIVCSACNRIQYFSEYQGAKVINPTAGIYRDPVVVLDYASLYPSSIVAKNISWETLVQEGRYVTYGEDGVPSAEGYDFKKVTYIVTNTGKEQTCWFARALDGGPGIIPGMLRILLEERSRTRKLIKKEKDPFKRRILDGQQLALKVTANSVYGQLGALTSSIHKTALAACTTAVGQEMLTVAQNFMEKEFPRILDTFPEDHWTKAYSPLTIKIIYGDTDSVFSSISFPKEIDQREKREVSIRLGQLAGELIKPLLEPPQDLEYEKTFHPWIILTKKRYVGLKYDYDVDKSSVSMMGICLKRRDFSRIVKKVCGKILHMMIFESSNDKIVKFVRGMIEDVVNGKFNIQDFVLSKRLMAQYKQPDRLAHVVLARRMSERDPAQAPQVGDRLSYVIVYDPGHLDKKNVLQADRVEEVGYVLENKLKVDLVHYVTNQVMLPSSQFLQLVTDNPHQVIFKPIIDKEMQRRRREKYNSVTRYFKPQKK